MPMVTVCRVRKSPKISPPPFFPLTNGLRIVGLLSMPQFTDLKLPITPVSNLLSGGYSNHVVAYVRSLSGPAVEKPPQDNPLIQADAFTYLIYSVNAAMATISLRLGSAIIQCGRSSLLSSNFLAGDGHDFARRYPGGPSRPWTRNFYSKQLDANLHELRLTFLWPVRPNGRLGTGRQTYRALIAGQISQTNQPVNQPLYFYQSQSFTNTP